MQPWEVSDPVVSSAPAPAAATPAPWEASDPVSAAPAQPAVAAVDDNMQPTAAPPAAPGLVASSVGSLWNAAKSIAGAGWEGAQPVQFLDPEFEKTPVGAFLAPTAHTIGAAAAIPNALFAAGQKAVQVGGNAVSPGLGNDLAAMPEALGGTPELMHGASHVTNEAAAAAGNVAAGALRFAPDVANAIMARVQAMRAAKGAAPEAVHAPLQPDELGQVLTHEDVDALAKANGVTDPNDPRIAKLRELLEPRRIDEAGRETRAPSSADATAMRTADEAIEDGAHPSAVMPPAREAQPATIQVGPSGMATPLDENGLMSPATQSLNEAVAARARPQSRALVPTEPQARPMSSDEVAAAQARNAASDNFEPNENGVGRLFTDQNGTAEPWQYPAGLLTHDTAPTESERVPHSQAVMAAEGRPAIDGPSNIHILPDDRLRPWDSKPPKGDVPGQGELPTTPTEPPPWLSGEEAAKRSTVSLLRDDKPLDEKTLPPKTTEPAPEGATPGAEPATSPASSPAPVETQPAPAAHTAAWTKARDTAAARVTELQNDVTRLRALRDERTFWNPDKPGASRVMPGNAEFPAGRPGDQMLLSAIRGKERGLADAAGRQKVAESALREIDQGRDPAYSPSYPRAIDNQAITTAAPEAPTGIIKTIQKLGGINDAGGDLRSQGLHKIPGLVNNKTGMGMDKMSDALAERGFFPALRAEMEDGKGGARSMDGPAMLMDAIKQEQAGDKVTPYADGERHAADMANHEKYMTNVDDAAERLGLDPTEVRGITRGQLADIMAERHSADELGRIAAEQDAHLEAAMEAAKRAHDEFRAEGGELPVDWEREESQPATQEDIENGGQPGTGESGAGGDTGGVAGDEDAGGAGPPASGESPLDGRATDRAGEPSSASRGEKEGGGADAVSGQGKAGDGSRGESPGRDPLRKSVEDDGQTVLPGAEASTKQAVAARQDAPLRGKVPQADTSKFDLFDPHARDQGKLATDAAKAADDISGKLFAGPTAIFDPAMWRFMFGPIKRGVLQPFADSFREMADAFGQDEAKAAAADKVVPRGKGAGTPVVARVDNALPRAARQINSMLRTVLYGGDSAMRAMADRLPAGSRAAMHDFLDLWHARAGEARGAAQTYHEGQNAQNSRMVNDLAGILGKKLPSKDELAQVVKMVQNPRSIRTGTRLGDIADGIRKWLGDAHKYQTDAGLDMGKIQTGYFPRRLDVMAISKNPDAFQAAAEKAFRDAGHPTPKEAAAAWRLDTMTNGANAGPIGMARDGLGGDHVNGRTLPKSADATLRPFLIQDPVQSLLSYAHAATRQAEFARVMGKDQSAWTTLTKALQKDGAEAALPRVADYVRTATGSIASKLTPGQQSAMGWMRLWGSMGLMAHSTITSLPEIFTAGARTGRLTDVGRQVKGMAGFWAGTKNGVRDRALAEDVGTVINHLGGSMAAARWVGDATGSAKQSAFAYKYFRMNGLEQWSQGMNTAATSVGDLFVRRMAGDIGAADTHGRQAAFALKELGIQEGQHSAFSNWIKGATNGGKDQMTPAALASAPKGMADAYRTAVFRFTRQVHMMPDAATRPGWASTPLGAMAFHLSNYTYAVHTNVIMRAARMVKDGDMTGADKLIVGAKIAMSMLTGVVASKMIGDARSSLLDSKSGQQSYSDHDWELALSRGQMMGAVDPWYQIFTGIKYHRDLGTSAFGPAGGRVVGAASAAVNSTQGINASKAEARKNTQALYDGVLMPTVSALSSFLPAPLGAAIIQYAGAGSTRDDFTNAVNGAPAPRLPKRK